MHKQRIQPARRPSSPAAEAGPPSAHSTYSHLSMMPISYHNHNHDSSGPSSPTTSVRSSSRPPLEIIAVAAPQQPYPRYNNLVVAQQQQQQLMGARGLQKAGSITGRGGQRHVYDPSALQLGIGVRSHSLDIYDHRSIHSTRTHTGNTTLTSSRYGHGYAPPSSPSTYTRRPSIATVGDDRHSTASSDDTHDGEGDNLDSVLAKFGGGSLTFTVNERPTLNDLLVPHAPSLERLNGEFEAFQTITGWFLGSQEAALSQYALWRPSVRVHQFVLPRLLHIPKVDLGTCSITPKLRRSILLVASMQYRCQYCAAHAAGLGDMLKGSWRSQVRAKEKADGRHVHPPAGAGAHHGEYNGGRPIVGLKKQALAQKPIIDPADSRNSARESELLKLVTAASRIPSKVTPELKKNVIAGFGVEGLQMAASIAGLFGWTNAITDSIGMELGVQDILFAREQIGPSGWSAARHAPAAFNESGDFTEREKMDSKRAEVTPRKGLKRFLDYATVLKHIHTADKLSASWATHIPSSSKQMDQWLNRHLGFVPAYIQCLTNAETKRSVCFMLWVFLIRSMEDKGDPCVMEEPCEWSNGAKALMFYVYTDVVVKYCTITGNLLLRGHAAHLAIRRKVPVNILVVAASGGKTNNARLDAALTFIRTSASLKRVYRATDNVRLLDTHQTAGGVMELAATLGLFNMLHRLSAMVAPEPVAFETEVREFLEVFGVVLGMDPKDAAPQSKEERSVADPLQFLYC
ncbi:hypothetical protein HK101_002037 [Irineochytrium annulatum]|nr:hypothetical protein HK101_002037 [Irineochytrium annulatum]